MIKKAEMEAISDFFDNDSGNIVDSTQKQKSDFSREEGGGEFLARGVGRTAKAAGSTFFGKYGDLQGLAQAGINKVLNSDPEEVQKWLESQEPDEFQPFGAPLTSEKIRSGIEKIMPSLAPRTPGEQKYEEGVELFTSLADPTLGGGVGLVRPAIGTAAGMAASGGAEMLGASPETQGYAKTIASIIPMVLKGGLTPGSGKAKELYDAGKAFGMTDKELTPLLQSEGKLSYLGKVAKRGSSTESAISSTQEALGSIYDRIKDAGSKARPLTTAESNALKGRLNSFKNNLSNTLKAAQEKQSVIDHVNAMISKLEDPNNIVSLDTLINSYQDINRTVNWNAIHGGKKALSEVKDFLVEAAEKVDPKIAKDFRAINRLQSKMYDFVDAVGKNKGVENFIRGSEVASFLTGVYTMNPKMIGAPILTESARRLTEAMLINPKFQYIAKNSKQAILSQSPKAASLAYRQFKDSVRTELPDDYEEIDWPE